MARAFNFWDVWLILIWGCIRPSISYKPNFVRRLPRSCVPVPTTVCSSYSRNSKPISGDWWRLTRAAFSMQHPPPSEDRPNTGPVSPRFRSFPRTGCLGVQFCRLNWEGLWSLLHCTCSPRLSAALQHCCSMVPSQGGQGHNNNFHPKAPMRKRKRANPNW